MPAANTEFDLASLPPIESITAATDIRAFLAPGVPPGRIHVVRLVRPDQRVDLFGLRLRLRVQYMYRYAHAIISTAERCVRIFVDGTLVKEHPWPAE